MSIDVIAQTVITCTGCSCLWLMASQEPRVRMWAAIIGLAGEPFWLLTAYLNEQWGIVALAFVYGFNWLRIGYINYKEVVK